MSEKAKAPAKSDLELAVRPNESELEAVGRAMADPALTAAMTMHAYQDNRERPVRPP